MAKLYMVATPIGNLDDMTFRGVETLKSVSLIGCEDTRHSLKLFNHFGIHCRLISCRAQNEEVAAGKIIEHLETGEDTAYVSDAGTPGISDPGARLAGAVRAAGFDVVPIPGASAITTLISAASNTGKAFTFVGFLSPKGGKRKRAVENYMAREESVIFYESPFRVVKLLKDITDTDNNRQLFIGRELTKKYEELLAGTAEELFSIFSSRDSIKGEFIILVSGQKKI